MRSPFVEFSRGLLESASPLARLGRGELGGKAQGLARIRGELSGRMDRASSRFVAPSTPEGAPGSGHPGGDPAGFDGVTIDIPSLVVVGTEVFDAFLDQNDLRGITASDLPDERIAHAFLKADLPMDILGDLRALVQQVRSPLAVRSSSLLEDALTQPFAGVYGTKMIPNGQYDPDLRFRQLTEAIKFVYASTFTRSAKDYRAALGRSDDEEKMAVIIQELVGVRHHQRFYPQLSGVARTYNYYPMEPARPEEGVVSLALGLGKTIVDGEPCWTYSPAHPQVEPPFGSVESLLKGTQTRFWAVNLGDPPAPNPGLETEYLAHESLTTAERDGTLALLASTYSPLSGRMSIGMGFDGPRALTFAPILALRQIPLNDLVRQLLAACGSALGSPVEIEFAMTFDPHRFGLLQVRAMEALRQTTHVEPEDLERGDLLVASETTLGNGAVENIVDIVYTRPETFDLTHTLAIVPELEHFNRSLLRERRPYVLICLGRLGTTDPWLGIPANWGKISGARVVVESTRDDVRVELSQGSHFFHNIVSLGVKYFNLPMASRRTVDWPWLARQPAIEETAFLRHVRLPRPLAVRVDGRTGRGVIAKPEGMP